MKKGYEKYSQESYFPQDIKLVENDRHKQAIFESYPEAFTDFLERQMAIFKCMHLKILQESEKGTKNVCYIIVSHLMCVHTHSTILKYLKMSGKFVDYNSFTDLNPE